MSFLPGDIPDSRIRNTGPYVCTLSTNEAWPCFPHMKHSSHPRMNLKEFDDLCFRKYLWELEEGGQCLMNIVLANFYTKSRYMSWNKHKGPFHCAPTEGKWSIEMQQLTTRSSHLFPKILLYEVDLWKQGRGQSLDSLWCDPWRMIWRPYKSNSSDTAIAHDRTIQGSKVNFSFHEYYYLFIYCYIYGVVLQLSSCITTVIVLQVTWGRGPRPMRRYLGLLMGRPVARTSD